MKDWFLDTVFSDGGDSTKASDNDNVDGAMDFETPLPNRKGGSWLSTDGR